MSISQLYERKSSYFNPKASNYVVCNFTPDNHNSHTMGYLLGLDVDSLLTLPHTGIFYLRGT